MRPHAIHSHNPVQVLVLICFLTAGLINPVLAETLPRREAFELLSRNPVTEILPHRYDRSNPAITPDGRYVVFRSDAELINTETLYPIYLYDRRLDQIELISVSSGGVVANSSSDKPSISDDGCKVVFESYATNLDSGNNTGPGIFLRDRCLSSPSTTQITSSGEGSYEGPFISGNGEYLAYYFSDVHADDGVYLLDLKSNVAQCISISEATRQCASAQYASLSADGSRMAFHSQFPLLKSDTNDVWDIYLYDKNATFSLSLVSTSSTGQQRNQGDESISRGVAPTISADGRYVAFATTSTNLVANDTNGLQDIFVKDTLTGNLIRASVSSSGTEGDHDSPIDQGERLSLSGDGTWVVFSTYATNLTPKAGINGNLGLHNNRTGETVDIMSNPVSIHTGPFAISSDIHGRFVIFNASDSLDSRFDSSGLFLHDRIAHCLLNWAEQSFSSSFAPAGVDTKITFPYTYRYFKQTNTYLGISSIDDHIYYLDGNNGQLSDVGAVSDFLQASGCS